MCLSVDKREKRQQTRNDVSVQCLCNVKSVMCWKLGILTPAAQVQTLVKKLSAVKISQLLSFVPFAVSTFVPPSATSKYLVEWSDV